MTAHRKLAAILAADVVGFSTMMQADEAGTMAALKRRRKEILESLVGKHRGRVIKLVGDRVLIEFASAVAAVECAVELQQAMSAANAANDPNDDNDKNVLLRIGVNLGDVLVEGSDLYGDGVNVAARLEALADPGTICVSAKVREEAQGKLDLSMEDRGEVALKNMLRPVHIFRISPCADLVGRARVPVALPLPDKPSIAVLPFKNLSTDPEQDYFADGMVEEVTMALSRMRWLFVIASASSFAYRGRAVDVSRSGENSACAMCSKAACARREARCDGVVLVAPCISCCLSCSPWTNHRSTRRNEGSAAPRPKFHDIA